MIKLFYKPYLYYNLYIRNKIHKKRPSYSQFKEDLFISNKYLKLGILSIFFKISQKIFQFRIYDKKIENKYIKDLNNP